MTTVVARNAPCPCGSGKRFKDCHGTVGSAPPAASSAEELLRQAQVAFARGKPAEAKVLLGRALELAPGRAELLRERARVEWTVGEATASASCRAALDKAPNDVAAWNLLGEILKASDAAGAEAAWLEALRLEPDDPEALFHLGNHLRERGDPGAAIERYERALGRAPGHLGVLNNLGLALEATGERTRAEACYRQVITAQSQHADALANLANLLQAQKRYREAVLTYEKTLTIRRDFPAKFWISRGIALGELGAFEDAEKSFREAARIAPDDLHTQVDIGSMCIVQGKFDAAEVPLARALELDPGNPYATTMLAHGCMQRCLWPGLDERFDELRAVLADPKPRMRYNAAPFPLLAMPLGLELELAAARRMSRQIATTRSSVPPLPARDPRPPGMRLRTGFVSSDFRDHAITYLLLEYWERLDRSRIEAYAYSLAPEDKSPIGKRVVGSFEHFVDCYEQSAEQTARRIRGDGIDVLIDLNGYTTHAKSEIFALRPAPVQVNWLGYLGTLGAEWYDYVLTDRFVSPPSAQAFFSERFLYLPDCYCPSDTRREVAAQVPSRNRCGLPERGLVFCCFNQCYKVLPAVFDVWMRLLANAPDSVLWLAPGNTTSQSNLRREAQARGVEPTRLVFARWVTLAEHLARHVHADLFLDTAPYNAGTTANDALFMGVPVVTCAGATMASRVAGSQLHAIGLPELVTTTLADYEALALSLTREPQRLAALKARLVANRRTQPLFDMARFSRALDDLLVGAWENHRR
jgi:predicted O-linked N-acetylglucosamine transferase (SPINDLY family)